MLIILSIVTLHQQQRTTNQAPKAGKSQSTSQSASSKEENNTITYSSSSSSSSNSSTSANSRETSASSNPADNNSYNKSRNTIAGLNSGTNLPSSEISRINSTLKVMLENNHQNTSTTDATVRGGSLRQSLTDSQKLIYTTTFIIDIPSLQKSYVVTDWYSPLPEKDSGLTDYTVVVTCPDVSQRIYQSDTNCTNYKPGV